MWVAASCALLLSLFTGLLGLDYVDTHPTEHGEDILDLLGIDLLRGQDRVDLVMCDVATLLGGADELYGRIGEAGQRAIRDGLAILLLQRPFLGLLGERLDLAYHLSPRPSLSPRRVVVRSRSR